MGFWELLEAFFMDPKWLGVQGVIAVLALIAAVVAAIDLIIRANRDVVNAICFETRRHPRENGRIEFELSTRPLAATMMYESEWLVFGDAMVDDMEEFPPAMDSNDDPVSITLSIPVDELPNVYVAVTHLVPAKLGSRKHASRIRLRDMEYQWWQHYRWYWWPRSALGRWKSNPVRKRSLLADPTP